MEDDFASGDVVQVHSLHDKDWMGLNGVLGVVSSNKRVRPVGQASRVPVILPEPWGHLPLLPQNITKLGNLLNVTQGAVVQVYGLRSASWRHLNGRVGVVIGMLDELGRVDVEFPPPFGVLSLRLINLAPPPELQYGLEWGQEEEHPVPKHILGVGSLVEAHSLRAENWLGLNGMRGVVEGPMVHEEDTMRIPVTFPPPYGTIPMRPVNLRPLQGVRYAIIPRRTPHDLTGGMRLVRATVKGVAPESPADKAGVEPGDQIVAIGLTPVTPVDDLPALLSKAPQNMLVALAPAGADEEDGWWGPQGSVWYGGDVKHDAMASSARLSDTGRQTSLASSRIRNMHDSTGFISSGYHHAPSRSSEAQEYEEDEELESVAESLLGHLNSTHPLSDEYGERITLPLPYRRRISDTRHSSFRGNV